jgi:hypothetical protein
MTDRQTDGKLIYKVGFEAYYGLFEAHNDLFEQLSDTGS